MTKLWNENLPRFYLLYLFLDFWFDERQVLAGFLYLIVTVSFHVALDKVFLLLSLEGLVKGHSFFFFENGNSSFGAFEIVILLNVSW